MRRQGGSARARIVVPVRSAILAAAMMLPGLALGQSAVVPSLPSSFSQIPGGRPALETGQPAPPGADIAFGAFQRGYFATAMNEAMKRLRDDPKDAAAMALIGEIYAQGLAVKRNPTEAAKWDRLASEQGNREATFSYGLALLEGDGVPQDKAKAKVLFEKAAAQGHPGALYNLGVLAIEGEGKIHEFGVAAAYFRRAIEAGDIDAMDALAALHKGGMGVAMDQTKAAGLYRQAADQKHVGAQVEYAIMLFNGDGVPKDEVAAAKYFRMAAYQGNPIAEDRLARLYAAGRGVARASLAAAHWPIMAPAAGLTGAWAAGASAGLTPADKLKVEDVIRKQLGQ